MMCPMFIVGLSLAMLVLLGGLFLLSYSKKEGLGMMTKVASYVAILFGTVVLVGGLICAMMCGSCKGKEACHKGKAKCKIEMRSHCGGGDMKCGGGSCQSGDMKCEGGDMKCGGGMKCHEKVIIKHCEKGGKMMCSKSDSGCCKDGVCKNADKDCCKGMKEEVIETTTVVKTK